MVSEYVFCPYYTDEAKNKKFLAHAPITYYGYKNGHPDYHHAYATSRQLAYARCYRLTKDHPEYDYIVVRYYPDGYMKSKQPGKKIGDARYIGPGGRKGYVIWTDYLRERRYKISPKGLLDELTDEDLFDIRRLR